MRLNLIAKPTKNNQLLHSIQCTPTYCKLEPGSNRVTTGLRNISPKNITNPARAVLCQVHLANMVSKLHAPEEQISCNLSAEGDQSWVLEQLDPGGLQQWTVEQQQATRDLLCKFHNIFSSSDLDLGKCNILKHDIE